MSAFVYHGSTRSNLHTLQPRVGTHGVPYVYAARDRALSLLFLCDKNRNKGDFSFGIYRPQGGPITLVERYMGAFTYAFKNVSGSIYVMNSALFSEGKTPFPEEVVSETAVKPRLKLFIPDSELAVTKAEKQGELLIYRYPDHPPEFPADGSDLIRLAVALTIRHRTPIFLSHFHSTQNALRSEAERILTSPKNLEQAIARWPQPEGYADLPEGYTKAFPQGIQASGLRPFDQAKPGV